MCPFRRLFISSLIIVVLFLLISPALSVWASGEVVDPSVEYTFGGQITFTARVASGIVAKEAVLSFRTLGTTATQVAPADLGADGSLAYTHDLAQAPLQAFTTVEYWFTLTLADGSVVTGDPLTFQYIDNRFNWQTLSDGPFHAHWYDGDLAFAQSVLDVAKEGLEHAQSLLPMPQPEDVDIYVYSDLVDYRSTLQLSGKDWMAGNAVVDRHLMVVAIPSGVEQRMEMERTIPHELMHILTYQVTGSGYDRLPIWLSEGLASMNQLYPTPDYLIWMEEATQGGFLIPINVLCQSFPMDQSGVKLAYAESYYFTRYIYTQYGASALQELVRVYADGVDCERGPEVAYGKPLPEVEKDWLGSSATIALPTSRPDKPQAPAPLADSLPWFVLLFLALIPPLAVTALASPVRSRTP